MEYKCTFTYEKLNNSVVGKLSNTSPLRAYCSLLVKKHLSDKGVNQASWVQKWEEDSEGFPTLDQLRIMMKKYVWGSTANISKSVCYQTLRVRQTKPRIKVRSLYIRSRDVPTRAIIFFKYHKHNHVARMYESDHPSRLNLTCDIWKGQADDWSLSEDGYQCCFLRNLVLAVPPPLVVCNI